MPENAASTAYGVVSEIALEHYQPNGKRIMDDPLAYQMLPIYFQWLMSVIGRTALRQGFLNLVEKSAPGVYGGILCRKRYIDDKVNEALDAGLTTVVVLGSGLDTLAYRNPRLTTAHVYEVDQPEIITHKSERLRHVYGAIPAQVMFVPLDFEQQQLESTLTAAGFSFDQPSLFVWEAVTQYLTEAGVRATLEVLAKAAAGSRLVFTYVQQDFIDGQNLYGMEGFYKRARVNSQLWKFGLDPDAVAGFIGGYGWKLLEQAGAAEYRQRYLAPIGRSDAVSEVEKAVYAAKE